MSNHQSSKSLSFSELWTIESVRLRDYPVPVEDSDIIRQLHLQHLSMEDKILQRAKTISVKESLDKKMLLWKHSARITLTLLVILAIMSGSGTVAGILASRHINILLALITLLGFHFILLGVWLIAMLSPWHGGGWCGEFWLWLTQKISRKDQIIVSQALYHLLSRNGSLAWLLSCISHGLWTLLLGSSTLSLLTFLSLRQYTFGWETTILSEHIFHAIIHTLGWLPSFLGFPIPSTELVTQSQGIDTAVFSQIAQTTWSAWLLGAVITYGLLPRLLCFIFSLLKLRSCLSKIQFEIDTPDMIALAHRLNNHSQYLGTDSIAPTQSYLDQFLGSTSNTHQSSFSLPDRPFSCLVGLDLPANTNWPPFTLDDTWVNAGILTTYQHQQSLLYALTQTHAQRLLVACDMRQTPDRGLLNLLLQLRPLCNYFAILMLYAEHPQNRLTQWQQRANELQLTVDEWLSNRPSQEP